MKFKKIISGISALSAIILLSSCSKVPAGYRGVIVHLYGSDKGVSEQSVGVGRYYTGWNSELYLFPTFLQNYSWKDDQSITMQTSDGLSIKTDAGITYFIQADNVVKVFQKYRLGIDEITNTFLHNMVRDAMNEVASTMTVEQIYGAQKELFISKVNEIVKKEAGENGIEVDKIYLVGSFQLPDTVINSINSKIQATQNAMKVENEVATSRAEAQKTIVEAEARGQQILINAESQAKANKILSDSLTSEFVQYQAILRWNGQLPTFTGNNPIPFINVQGK
ncbi:MAG TPA: SPFH domain-containing protein [Aquella sp.]|nr:SPFH domain-containing protein [Aquella sp.]